MAKQVIRRQGSSQEHASFTGAEGEWTHDNTLNTGRFHDGVLSGGYPALLSNKINEISVSTNLDGSNFGEIIIADSTSSSFTITLPDPSAVGSGWQVAIKKSVNANSVTVSPFGGEGIDGDASVILENAENAVQVRTDGTSWYALRLNNFDDAQEILYDNSTSGLSATTVQGAIDEVVVDSNDFATIDGGNTFNGNQTLNDNLSVNGDVSFQSYSFPSTDGSAGQALLTDGAGNLSFSDVGGDIISEGNSNVEVIDTGVGQIALRTDGAVRGIFDSSGLKVGNTAGGDTLIQSVGASNTDHRIELSEGSNNNLSITYQGATDNRSVFRSQNVEFMGVSRGSPDVNFPRDIFVKARSVSTNGYAWLPNGILLQWGEMTTTTSNETKDITLPIAFPNNFFSLAVADGNSSESPGGGIVLPGMEAYPISNSQFRIEDDAEARTSTFIAIGN